MIVITTMFERTHVRPLVILLVGVCIGIGNGFVVGPQQQYPRKFPCTILSSTSNTGTIPDKQEDDDRNESINKEIDISNQDITSPFEPGSHSELMYTLGINLARQLGDIRPLVEDGDELVHVAKGLLDTVIGRLTEDRQKALLASRGRDLNALITERAYVV
jgi:hypothetical protein